MRLLPLLAILALSGPLAAQDSAITITDAHARILPGARAGAVYLSIENGGAAPDRLLDAATPIAKAAHLHTSLQGADGMMQMQPVEGGIEIAPGASHVLESGADHLMLMGLVTRPAEGESFPLTLTFEGAGEVTVEVTVDNRP